MTPKNCPFCGKPVEIVYLTKAQRFNARHSGMQEECFWLNITFGRYVETEEQAVSLWNTRKGDMFNVYKIDSEVE